MERVEKCIIIGMVQEIQIYKVWQLNSVSDIGMKFPLILLEQHFVVSSFYRLQFALQPLEDTVL